MSQVKEHFVSRFKNGILLNGDLSQIEIVLFAHLSRDQNLITLIKEGVDVHKYMYNKVYGTPLDKITKEMRSGIKAVDFGIIYGNGPKTAAERTGLSEDECKEIIETFYREFPNTRRWQNYNLKKVKKHGELRLQTGSKLKFKKYPAKYEWQIRRGVIESYNPPDIKNYPVQHLAAVLMKLILGRFFRKYVINQRDKYLLINTVHDSIMLDCVNDYYASEAENQLTEIVSSLPNYFKELWNIELLLPVKMEFSRGASWLELK